MLSDTLDRIDADHAGDRQRRVPNEGVVAASEGAIWAPRNLSQTYRLALLSGGATALERRFGRLGRAQLLSGGPRSQTTPIAMGQAGVWLANGDQLQPRGTDYGTALHLDPRTDRLLATIAINGATAVSAGAGQSGPAASSTAS